MEKMTILICIFLFSCSSVALKTEKQLLCDKGETANNNLYEVFQGGKKVDELCITAREPALYIGPLYLTKKGAPCRCR